MLESEKLRLINNKHLLIALYIPVLSTGNIPISSICKLRQDFSKPLEDRLIIRCTFVRTILFNHDFYDWFGGTRFRSSKTHFRLSKRKTHQTHQLSFYSLDLLLHLGEQKSWEKREMFTTTGEKQKAEGWGKVYWKVKTFISNFRYNHYQFMLIFHSSDNFECGFVFLFRIFPLSVLDSRSILQCKEQ